ncbi:restriction endonuclease subunit R [Gordonibacter sp. An230]|uniref:type I restriction endonuclease subunit R n=1 Tax=Gordonibacter sp. An230 TaxID=1965592 RepID=UPI000B3AD5CF|nr:type I restriction endonuclease [Gordonibacter sp. An230]OUO89846.1 restriction endonuclease subunit R [Gordonibacter sp. An230]
MANEAKERNLEEDIEAFLCSEEGGWLKATDRQSFLYIEDGSYQAWDDHGYADNPGRGVDIKTLASYVQATQPKTWALFEKRCGAADPERMFLKCFTEAVSGKGIVDVLKHGFKHRGLTFKVVSFRPESSLNAKDAALYRKNCLRCIRQFHYSAAKTQNTVDIVLDINGIPVVAIELKDQFTGQSITDARRQWREDRDPREEIFRFNSRVVAFFAVDLTECWIATKLAGEDTRFLPFNQGSNGAGEPGDAGNPPNEHGYMTSHLWEKVLQADSLLDILNRYVHLEVREETVLEDGQKRTCAKRAVVFPRYHQLDAVRRICADVRESGPGKSYLVQHSAGSGKSNSIAWCAYQLSTMFDARNRPVFDSVVVVTDRTVLDRQLQETIGGKDHIAGQVVVIDDRCSSQDLKNALNDGARLIVSTLQKYSVICSDVASLGKTFCVIIDEAHSSQTGSHAENLRRALADPADALAEFADYDEQWEDASEAERDGMLESMLAHGRHANLTFLAFTATPKDKTLELFGIQQPDGSFKPFHVYSMMQAIREGFILDPLANYVTYKEALEIAKKVPDNPDCPTSPTLKLLRKYTELHPYALAQKSRIIVETYREVTRKKIGGRGKMMVVTNSRLAAVRYYHEIKRYMDSQGYDDMEVLVAFSGVISDPSDGPGGPEYTEGGMNVGHDGRRVRESQTKAEFHTWGSILVVAEKYQTGFDEPLLHTLIVDKRLRREKAVQTICRIDRTCPGKNDTLVIDFANDREDILKAFQPFYTETDLCEPVDTDRIYPLLEEIRGYGVYTDEDVTAAVEIEFGKNRENVQGRMAGVLIPGIRRYNALDDEERYQFRRKVRNFRKWYAYVTQLVRMFDREMQREYVYLGYLSHLLSAEKVELGIVDQMVRLDYYKLERTWEGSIELADKKGEIEQGKRNVNSMLDKRTDPLEELIARINREYAGNLTEDDKVVITSILRHSEADQRVRDSLAYDDEAIFTQSIWPKVFGDAAMDAYMRDTEAYASLFEDKAKYNAVMKAVGELLLTQHRKGIDL